MSEITIKEPQGIVDSLNDLIIQKLEAKKLLSQLTEELENTDLYKRVQSGKEIVSNIEKQESEIKELGKNIMIESGIKKFEALDGTVVQLNKTPGALIIEDDSKLPPEYTKTKTTTSIDKAQIKKDLKEGLILEGVSIKEDYKLVVKQ